MSEDQKPVLPPVLVSPADLQPETLNSVLESFVLREGTDYGSFEISLEQKIENLRKKIATKDIVLVFDPNTESLNFLTQIEWTRVKLRHD